MRPGQNMGESGETILRRWSALIRTADEEAYVGYLKGTGLADYAATSGNLGFQLLLRACGDGTSEVTTLSWWTSMEAIAGFAGADPGRARYYPADDRFLLTRPDAVEHHRVALGTPAP